jgi:chorismate mutase
MSAASLNDDRSPLPPPCGEAPSRETARDPDEAGRTLDSHRRHIDAIDARIVRLLEERMQVARLVGATKRAADLPLVASAREVQVLERAAAAAGGALAPHDAREIFRAILAASRRAQANPA